MEIRYVPLLDAKVENLLDIAKKSLPEHQRIFDMTYSKIKSGLEISGVISMLKHVLELIDIEKSSEEKIKGMKVFESAEGKLKQANLSFRKDDYASTFHNLNTALELVLKDKLGIPTTITGINTSKPIDLLVKHKIEPYLFLAEAKKHIIRIDNKIKHQGYSPSKIECINGIKVMEELIAKLRDREIKLSEEVRNKIYEGL